VSEQLNEEKKLPTPRLCEGDQTLVLLTLGVLFYFAAAGLPVCRSAAVGDFGTRLLLRYGNRSQVRAHAPSKP